MLIVGERINTSRKAIQPAVENRDADFIIDTAKSQVEAGANYIDANAGTLLSGEPDALEWLVQTIQGAVDAPICIDSPNPAAIERALAVHKGQPMINSITGEKERFEGIAPLVKHYGAKVIALAMGDDGIPENAVGRVTVARRVIDDLTGMGVPLCDIYVDPLVYPVANGSQYGMAVLETIRTVKGEYPGIHALCGLSNVSHGLPIRKLINQAFLAMCVEAGLDAAIIDPLDQRLMSLVFASEAIIGCDEYCVNYLTAAREGKFEGVA